MAKEKAEKVTSLDRNERAASLILDINKKMKGRAVLMPASDYVLPWVTKRLPTGLLTLDLELRGGFPAGGLSQLIGRRSAGKTLLAWEAVRQLQHFMGDKAMTLLAMTEIQADREQARKAGVKISLGSEEIQSMNEARKRQGKDSLTKKEINEGWPQVGTIHELHATSAEDFYDVLLRAVEENIYHIIVLDSIGNILSAAEQENESVHDKVYGGAAAPNTTFLKKMTNLLTMRTEAGEIRDTCILAINQVRDDLKDPNKPYKASGGNALEHAKLIDIYVESGTTLGDHQSVYTPDGWKQQFVATGKEVNWKIVKGKAGIHEGAKGKLVFRYDTSTFDFVLDSIVAGITHGIIEQAGAWLGIRDPKDESKYLIRSQGKDAFVAALKEDALSKADSNEVSHLQFIRDACYEKLGIDIKYDNWK